MADEERYLKIRQQEAGDDEQAEALVHALVLLLAHDLKPKEK